MRHRALIAMLVAATALTVMVGTAVGGTIVFGRLGGNIDPSSVTIGSDGRVTVQGTMQRTVTATSVPPAALSRITKLITKQRFLGLPPLIRCSGALPDFAASFITVTTGTTSKRTVLRGDCSARFLIIYRALIAAVTTHG